MLAAIKFPPISHLLVWPDIFFEGTFYAVNKIALLFVMGAAVVLGLTFASAARGKMVPGPLQNLVESTIAFVRNHIIMQTIGPDGLRFAPFLITIFSFIFVLNMIGLFPIIQMPANARMALPALLAIVVWLVYNGVGIAKHGPWGYFKSVAFPPGVPWPIYILVTPIELVSVLIVRPLSLMVRLFANLLAGHLILVSFAVLCQALYEATYIGVVAPFAVLVGVTGFEVLVGFLQAYIFTILAAVYIGGALHPEH